MSSENRKQFSDSFIVINEKGLHARPSTELAKLASVFKSEVIIHYEMFSVNAKSLVGVLMLAIDYGDKVKVEAFGEDAEEAVKSIVKLANNKFQITC